jgi:hypothetical protein
MSGAAVAADVDMAVSFVVQVEFTTQRIGLKFNNVKDAMMVAGYDGPDLELLEGESACGKGQGAEPDDCDDDAVDDHDHHHHHVVMTSEEDETRTSLTPDAASSIVPGSTGQQRWRPPQIAGARLVGVNGIVVEHLGFNDVAKILSQVGHGTLRYLQESLTVPAAAYGVMTEHSVAGPLGGRKDLELSLRRSPILYRLELMYV